MFVKALPALDSISLSEKLNFLIIGRIFVLLLLIILSLVWNSDRFPASIDIFRQQPYFIFALALILSILFLLISQTKKNLLLQVAAQFIIDASLITWLVWSTGDVNSPYTPLYTVLICLTIVFFDAHQTFLTAIACAIVYTVINALIQLEVLPRFNTGNNALSTWQAVQVISFHNVAFIVVGLLASQLSARQKRSITELKEATQNLAELKRLHEFIVQSIRTGLVTTNLDGTIFLFNSAAEEITGLKAADMQGKTIFNLLGEDVQQRISFALRATANGEQPPRFDTDYTRPQGDAIRLGYGISPLNSEDGETTGLVITFQDLTEIRLMEENVRRQDRLAAVGRVSAGLAHEIRNPLGAMRGAIQVLQAGMEMNSSQAELMDIILRESDRLNSIITNFLQYARPRSAEFTNVDMRDIIRDAVTLLRHSPDIRQHHEIIEDLPPHQVFAVVDATALKQVFWNLTRNAVQAMSNGGRITVKLRQLPNNILQIVFTDTGQGMPQAQVEKLFEPFSESTTGGTGLGLSIVYQIIRDHHGAIDVRSKQNVGTSITIELPTIQAAKVGAKAQSADLKI
jgi:two-component system sensor histidine kinase PilS (NtrC family)